MEITNNNKKVENVLHNTPSRPLNHRKNDANGVHAEIDVQLNQMIHQAAQQTSEPSKIEAARKLLASNQLDTPENIRKAAENIIKYGL